MKLKGILYRKAKKLLVQDSSSVKNINIKGIDKGIVSTQLTFKQRPTNLQIKRAKEIIEENNSLFEKEHGKRNYLINFENQTISASEQHLIKLLIHKNFDLDELLESIKEILEIGNEEREKMIQEAREIITEKIFGKRVGDVIDSKKIIKGLGFIWECSNFNGEDFYRIAYDGKMIDNRIFSENEIVDAIIKNNFDLDKSITFLVKERNKKDKENAIQEEIEKIEARKRRREIREEAEKKVFGEVKSGKRREAFTEDEKEMILEKFGNKCSVCGKEEGLHIHHKDENSENNRMDNLIVLCGVCHKKIHMKVR